VLGKPVKIMKRKEKEMGLIIEDGEEVDSHEEAGEVEVLIRI
jgi:hypothetical protein